MNDDDIRYIKEYYPVEDMNIYVRMGVYDRETLIDLWCEQMLDPADYDENMRHEVARIIDWLQSELDEEMAEWPDVTDCDLLDRVFARLTSQGIVCSHYVGLEETDGFGTGSREYHRHPDKSRVVGYCFYTADCMKSAIVEAGMYISYGSLPKEFEPAEVVKVGQAIMSAFEAEGFEVQWDGDPDRALLLVDFLWQK
jgi:hypothetical protein